MSVVTPTTSEVGTAPSDSPKRSWWDLFRKIGLIVVTIVLVILLLRIFCPPVTPVSEEALQLPRLPVVMTSVSDEASMSNEVWAQELLLAPHKQRALEALFVFDQKQEGSCTLHALANLTALIVAGRPGPVVDLDPRVLLKQLKLKFGTNAQRVDIVLKHVCELHDLRYRKISPSEAQSTSHLRSRPILMVFGLDPSGWRRFRAHLLETPKKVIDSSSLQVERRKLDEKDDYHAAILLHWAPGKPMVCLNSWGPASGNDGRFYVSGASVFPVVDFYDLYWTPSQEFSALQAQCPACRLEEPLRDFREPSCNKAKCPNCGCKFLPALSKTQNPGTTDGPALNH